MKINNFYKLLVAIGISELAGVVGSIFTTPAIPVWYAGLIKPTLNPPSWIFGPVWITLFLLMGVASFLIWQKGANHPVARKALGIFSIQLALNTLWSILFFGLKNPGLAFIEILVLWLAILVTIKSFAKISRLAAWLLAPYILWVSFAVYLNLRLWMLN